MNYRRSENDICGNCGEDGCWQESVDIGVGVIYGPKGCPVCGWSEDDEYNLAKRESALDEKGGAIDQWGGYHPPGSLTAKAYRMAEGKDNPE